MVMRVKCYHGNCSACVLCYDGNCCESLRLNTEQPKRLCAALLNDSLSLGKYLALKDKLRLRLDVLYSNDAGL